MEDTSNLDKIHIGLFFGSFDPIHVGHLQIGSEILKNSLCDKIWFIVSPNNPFKINSKANFFNRIYMTSLAINNWNETRFEISTLEASLSSPFYTQKTLNSIKISHPKINFSVIIGEDNLYLLRTWYNSVWIVQNFPFLVYKREMTTLLQKNTLERPFGFVEFCERISWIPGKKITISSEKIREGFFKKNTKPISNFITKNVLNFIVQNKIYTTL